jgi:quercetin dioxygenase-like cupin family protein
MRAKIEQLCDIASHQQTARFMRWWPGGKAMRPSQYIGALASSFALLYTGFILGQQNAPTDYKLVKEDVLAAIDLAKEIDGVQGRELRLSSAVISPGGHVGLHSHRGDPTIVYMLSGVLTNHRDDGTVEEFHSGQAFAEYGPRSHWVENKGRNPVHFIVANVHRQ